MSEPSKAELSQDKATDVVMKLNERTDSHVGAAILFLGLALVLKIWGFDVSGSSLMPLKIEAKDSKVVIGILGMVGIYNLLFALALGIQAASIGTYCAKEFREIVLPDRMNRYVAFFTLFAVVVITGILIAAWAIFDEMRAVLMRVLF